MRAGSFGAFGECEVFLCKVVEANLFLLVDAEVFPLDVFEFNVHQHLFGKFLVRTNAPLVAFAMNPIVDVPIFAHSSIRITSVKDTHVTPPFSSVLSIRSTVYAAPSRPAVYRDQCALACDGPVHTSLPNRPLLLEHP